jgi:hypothetical protein
MGDMQDMDIIIPTLTTDITENAVQNLLPTQLNMHIISSEVKKRFSIIILSVQFV